jgi:Nucleotidyltransferase domain.
VVDIEELKQEILERLRPLDPERVILFGSYAHGNPTEDSDIDLYVVTKAEWEGQFYQEKEVTVYYKVTDEGLILLTAKARYGQGFPRGRK